MEHIIFDQLYFYIFKKKKKKQLEEQPYYGERKCRLVSPLLPRHSAKYFHTHLIKFSQKFYKTDILPFIL